MTYKKQIYFSQFWGLGITRRLGSLRSSVWFVESHLCPKIEQNGVRVWGLFHKGTDSIPKNTAFVTLSLFIVCMHAKSLQLCLTLCDPMDCSPPGSSVQGILQARIPECVAMPFSRGSSQPRDQTASSVAPTPLGHQGSLINDIDS